MCCRICEEHTCGIILMIGHIIAVVFCTAEKHGAARVLIVADSKRAAESVVVTAAVVVR